MITEDRVRRGCIPDPKSLARPAPRRAAPADHRVGGPAL